MKIPVNHVFFIDALAKLNLKKDSTLLFAHAATTLGQKSWALFEDDFYYDNGGAIAWKVYEIETALEPDGYYLKSVQCQKSHVMNLNDVSFFHMRLDPPFDGRYLRYLWMLRSLKAKGLRIVNDPDGILLFNEKMVAYQYKNSHETFVGKSLEHFLLFVEMLRKKGGHECILKPLDLYQGMGVVKIDFGAMNRAQLQKLFEEKTLEYGGVVVAQPYVKNVEKGEIRSLYFDGKHLGSILKTPKKGEFLANIAQGATYEKCQLSETLQQDCENLCREMLSHGIRFVAFDILGQKISEANVTCPGLVVEVSKANHVNYALEIIKRLQLSV